MSILRAVSIGTTIAVAIFGTITAGIWALTAGAWAQCNGPLAVTGSCQTGADVHNITAALTVVSALVTAGLTVALVATRPRVNATRE